VEGTYRILIVEDNPAGRRLLSLMLAEGPYTIEEAPDADAALEILERETIHLVITDVNLPGQSGLELLEHVRTHHPRLPVILITADPRLEIAVQALRLGATNFIQKPFSVEEITEIVRKSLRPWAINAGKRSFIPEMKKRLCMILHSSNAIIDPVFYHIYDDALSLGFPEPVLRLNVYLTLNEALANAVRHGNKNDPEKQVRVEAELTADEVSILITDEGEGFDPGELPDPTAVENLLKTSGRGIFLMRCYMDEVEYLENGRTLRLKKFASDEGLREDAERL
jgi:DNA-binding response OmpR family regulator